MGQVPLRVQVQPSPPVAFTAIQTAKRIVAGFQARLGGPAPQADPVHTGCQESSGCYGGRCSGGFGTSGQAKTHIREFAHALTACGCV